MTHQASISYGPLSLALRMMAVTIFILAQVVVGHSTANTGKIYIEVLSTKELPYCKAGHSH